MYVVSSCSTDRPLVQLFSCNYGAAFFSNFHYAFTLPYSPLPSLTLWPFLETPPLLVRLLVIHHIPCSPVSFLVSFKIKTIQIWSPSSGLSLCVHSSLRLFFFSTKWVKIQVSHFASWIETFFFYSLLLIADVLLIVDIHLCNDDGSIVYTKETVERSQVSSVSTK